MLKGVEDTKDQWVLANNNLNYALYYLANTNTMVDYPYLTYNDLKEAQELYMQSHNKAKMKLYSTLWIVKWNGCLLMA